MTDSTRYAPSSIALHWIVALLLLVNYGVAFMLDKVPKGWGDTAYKAHWSIGLLILLLIVVRLVNRFVNHPPPPYPSLTPLELALSTLVHKALYLLLIITPVLGWLAKSAYGGDITVFGLFNMPPLLPHNEKLGEQLFELHKLVAASLLGLLALHIAGALNHALIKRDGVLARMWPWAK